MFGDLWNNRLSLLTQIVTHTNKPCENFTFVVENTFETFTVPHLEGQSGTVSSSYQNNSPKHAAQEPKTHFVILFFFLFSPLLLLAHRGWFCLGGGRKIGGLAEKIVRFWSDACWLLFNSLIKFTAILQNI